MAKASIECKCPECGAEFRWEVKCLNRREADNWERYHSDDTDRLCSECYRKAMERKRTEECAVAAEEAAAKMMELGFPALTGSEKQVSWANTIRQNAVDAALTMLAGRTSSALTDEGKTLVAGVVGRMSTEAKWWIDNRADAADMVQDEVETANWARLDERVRKAKMEAYSVRKAELDAKYPKGEKSGMTKIEYAGIERWERMERARKAGRMYAEQRETDKAEKEAARQAALPPKPAKLVERLGFAVTARWNGKFYGRDGLRIYVDGNEVSVPAEVKSAWNAEWTAYKKATGKN